MTFKEFYGQSWNEHATDAKKVYDRFSENLKLPETSNDIVLMGNLIVHVAGEHLGLWNEGIKLLNTLKENPLCTDVESFNRYEAILQLGADKDFDISHFSSSDKARIFAVVASALTLRNEIDRSEKYLTLAGMIAGSELEKTDPANRTLAVTGNGIASELEEKTERTKEEVELMKLAAHTARIFWEKAGTWKEIERAEYRLAHTHIKAGELTKAFIHAQKCLSIVEENGNEPLEAYFGYEVLAHVERARNNQEEFDSAVKSMESTFQDLSAGEQGWAKEYLDKLKSVVKE